MADKKISELTNYTSPIDTDVLPIVDVTAGATKKITKENLTSDKATAPASSVDDRIATFDGITGKLLKDGGKTIAEVEASSIPATYLDTDGTLTANSDTKVASQKAVKTYADTKLAKATDVTSINDTGIADGEISVFNKTNKDIRTSDKVFSTDGALTGDSDNNIPTEKAVKTYVDTAVSGISSNSITVTAAPASDHLATGVKIVLPANENQAFGDVCFINADGQAQLGDADAIATASCIAMCADNTINADASGNYLLMGVARDDTWAWTVGGLIYLTVTGTSGNTLSQTAPSGTNDVVQIMGVATHADRMYFNPQLVQVEHI